MKKLFTILVLLCLVVPRLEASTSDTLVVGNERLSEYIHLMQGRRVGVMTNHTATIEVSHLVDTLLKSGIEVRRIFTCDERAHGGGIQHHRDSYAGVEIVPLGEKPKANDVFGCGVVVCDMTDAGMRLSQEVRALVEMMQVCADIGVPLVVLDRPNSRGGGVDGAIVEPQLRAKGELPLPLLYGMTLGELARMVNGEGWLAGGVKCPLTVVPCLNYNRHHYDSTVELLSRGLSVEVPVAEGGDIDLTEVVSAYIKHTAKEEFFVGEEFDRMMGTGYVRSMITLGYTAEEVEGVWRSDAERFATQCKPYLIYEN